MPPHQPRTQIRQTPERSRVFYHPEVDVLRFGAFFLVYLSHALPSAPISYQHLGLSSNLAETVVGLVNSGRYGVDLFFALSSYLITELLLREFRLRRSIDVKAFYVRRILRIWPLYFLALYLGPVVLHAIKPAEPLLGKRQLLAFTLLMGNWARAWWGFPASATGPLWSVSIEEQFYLFWPLVMSRWISYIRPISAGLIVCAFTARAYYILGHVHPEGVWFNTFCRLDPIAGGALLASFLGGKVPRFRTSARIAMIMGGLASLGLCGVYSNVLGKAPLVAYPIAAVASILMIAGTLRPVSDSRPAGILRIFIYLGRISYGLYVFHAAAIHLTHVNIGSAARWALNLSESLGLTVLLAAISYRFIETPFLLLKRKFSYVQSSPQADYAERQVPQTGSLVGSARQVF